MLIVKLNQYDFKELYLQSLDNNLKIWFLKNYEKKGKF